MVTLKRTINECCEILGISSLEINNENEIRKAYRRLAIKWHPDKNPVNERQKCEAKFKDIVEAYDIMMSPSKRRQAEYISKKKEIFSNGMVGGARTARFDGSLFGGGAKFAKQGTNPGLINIKSIDRINQRVNKQKYAREGVSPFSDKYANFSDKFFKGLNGIFDVVSNAVSNSEESFTIATTKLRDIKNAIIRNAADTHNEIFVSIKNSLEQGFEKNVIDEKITATQSDLQHNELSSTIDNSSNATSEDNLDGDLNSTFENIPIPEYRSNILIAPNYRIPNYVHRQSLCGGSQGPHLFAISKGCSVQSGKKYIVGESLNIRHAKKKIPHMVSGNLQATTESIIYPQSTPQSKQDHIYPSLQ
ncbi:hypothetical protein cand_007340 [Cryptosporidium andersoni]|uniref:J domain-containing protein n=1 Tax=Cryptosporidium andersoni TaxID=117008 RepID=A0A1J4MPG5_9CRYT|nr:hypothetical protein cand_007340 [Cryptosporidium andersoni]